MFKALVEGLILGLSTGTVCLVTCTPIYLPWLISENRSIRNSFYKILEISAGRFIAYILFGAVAGYFGSQIQPDERILYTGISYILLSIFLLLNVLRTHREGKKCHVPRWITVTKSAFLMGIFTGVNFCPSFLIALSKAVDLGGVWGGIQIFCGFFFGTTLFLLPLAFSGYLTLLKEIKVGAKIAAILVAGWFIWQGSAYLLQTYNNKQKISIDLMEYPFQPIIIYSDWDSITVDAFSDTLQAIYNKPAMTIHNSKPLSLPQASLIIVEQKASISPQVNAVLTKHHHVIISGVDGIDKLSHLLRNTRVLLNQHQKLDFIIK